MELEPRRENHHLISPTAKLTAHFRAETDIPFSKEIDELCDAGRVNEEVFGKKDDLVWKTGKIELRYKSLTECLKRELGQRNISQVIELASGLLPRGILLSKNPDLKYIETDLPEMAEEKRRLVLEIDPSLEGRKNYVITSLNAVNPEEFAKVEEILGEGKVAIVNEGLLSYLTVEEKESLATNIHNLLEKNGGVWITPDLSNSEGMKKIIEIFPDAKEANQKLNNLVGRDMRSNSVGGGKDGSLEFYRNLGFKITEYKASELAGHLVSLDKMTDEPLRNKLLEALDTACVWVLEVNN